MYRQLRLRLTAWFLLLSGLTCIALAAAGAWLCYQSINDSLDKTLEALIAGAREVTEVKGDKPHFVYAPDKGSTGWSHHLSTVQLYTPQGELIQEDGPPAIRKLLLDDDYFEGEIDGRKLRGTSDPIEVGGRTVGYLQAEVPVAIRDKAVEHFITVMACLMPFLLLGLAVTGYFFAGKASTPAERSFILLRQFLSDASHELRTPVHAIQLTAENAALDTSEAQMITDLNAIVRSTDRMSKLIDDMTMLTNIEIHQLQLKTEQVNISQVVTHVAQEFRHSYRDKDVALEVDAKEEAIVEGDKHSLSRLISNLLQNVLRYTDAGGKVIASVAVSAREIHVSISDTGVGISPADLQKIFDRFYRVDKSRSRAAGGSGLGLAIVKAICDTHKGSISVQSEEGKGSTFTVTLPRGRTKTTAEFAKPIS